MLRSVITMSKDRSCNACNPSTPLAAVVTRQPRRVSERANASRIAALSSTIKTEYITELVMKDAGVLGYNKCRSGVKRAQVLQGRSRSAQRVYGLPLRLGPRLRFPRSFTYTVVPRGPLPDAVMPSFAAMERAPSFPSPMGAMTRSSLSVSNAHAMTSVHACFARPRPCASDLNAQSSSKSVPSSAGDRTSPATPTLAPPSTITNKWWGCSSSGNGRVPTNSHTSSCCSRELSSSSSDWLSGRSSTALTAVWPARDAPPPVGHRRVGIHRGTGLRVQDRQAGAPLEIRDQCRPELRVAWQRDLIGGVQHRA